MSKKVPSQERPAQKSQPLQGNWPLGGGTHDILTTELEWSVLRFYSAFERSCEQLADMAGSPETNFSELVLLHVIAMQRSPQPVSSLARQLNRDDIPNLQYGIRKLCTKNLLQKAGVSRGKQTTYELTKEGARLVGEYASLRHELLTSKTGIVQDVDLRLEDAARLISLLTGLYDNVAQAGATYRRT
ncbi:winged helix DNA-binding protein [Luminiphilus sp.]|jgi:predicted MarR family transcription regulator|nr:winged helix DNA-binding protein [Luminiphilus sp.]MDA9798099.1 winged helix DNA-binding protein [Luminiphilus sp.]|tara:strand:+ start:831 stop:1391 length:561 start_codon:yes stop_codon:yes gene_type:complete